MDTTTLFLAQLIGPVMLAVGIGIFYSRDYYMKVYRHLENETLAVLMSGVVAIVAGIALVTYHNRWDTLVGSIVTLIGWLSILKGFLLIVAPRLVDKLGDYLAGTKWFTFAGIFYITVGVYLSYVAYLA